MPGVQKPHWLRPAAQKASAQRVAHSGVEAVDRGDRAAGHAAHRRDARHAGLPVDQHRAAPALTLGAAAVLRRTRAERSRSASSSEHASSSTTFAAIEGEGRHR